MYYPGQIVWSIDHNKPVKVGDDISGETVHFINSSHKVVYPNSIEEANLLLQRRRIVPAPGSEEHCWSCKGWLTHSPSTKCESKEEHYQCADCGQYGTETRRFGKWQCGKCLREFEEHGLLSVAEELILAIKECKSSYYNHDHKVAEAMNKLNELMDPYEIQAESRMRAKIQDMVSQYKERKSK